MDNIVCWICGAEQAIPAEYFFRHKFGKRSHLAVCPRHYKTRTNKQNWQKVTREEYLVAQVMNT
jgi:hypothetical protein